MLLVKPANGLRAALLQLFQGRPFRQEVADHTLVQISGTIQCCGKVLFEKLGEFIGEANALTGRALFFCAR
jgi:hypothetical protein